MFNKFKSLSKISLVSAGNVANSLVGFIFLTAVARSLTLEDFGKYSLVTSLLVSISKLIDFGTNSTYVAKSISTEDHKLTDIFYSLKILLLLASMPISALSLFILGIFSKDIFILFLAGLISYAINYTLYAIFQKNEMYIHLILLNFLPALIKGFASLLIFLSLIKVSINSTFGIFAISVASGMILIPFLPVVYRKFKFNLVNSISFLKESLSPGISLSIYEAWPAINNAIAKISTGFSDVGIFSLANKISNVFSLISLGIFTVLLPKNAARKKKKLSYDFGESIFLGAGLLIMSVVAIILSELFITYVFGDKFRGSIKLLDLLIFASALTATQSFLENYFYVEEKTGYLGSINSARLVVFVTLSLFFVQTMGLKGLAYANLISSVLGLFITIFIINTLHRLTKQEVL